MLGYMLRNNPFETYRIEMNGSAFCFVITKEFFEYICTMVTQVEVRTDFLAIRREEGDQLVTFFVDLPFITYPNYAHKSLDWEILRSCAEQISLLLYLFNHLSSEEGNFFLTKDPQLLCVETTYRSDTNFHACALEVGYSEDICNLLSKKYIQDTVIHSCEESTFKMYYSLFSKRKREFEKAKKDFGKYRGGFMGITVKVRKGGVPHFVVPGNCACLGANPDEFKYQRDMYSHNLDTSLQQMTMLAAIVSFWNDVLKPHYLEGKVKEVLTPV